MNQGLLLVILLTVILYYGKLLLIPLVGAVLLAMLMTPLSNNLERKGFTRKLSCLVAVLILLMVFTVLFYILLVQLTGFAKDLPVFQQKLNALLMLIQQKMEENFNLPAVEQAAVLQSETEALNQNLKTYIAQVIQRSLRLLVGMVVTLFFTFLMLYHREKYHHFFIRLTPGETADEKNSILLSASNVAEQYLKGRAISILFFFVCYLLTLLIIGVKGALLLAAVAALANIIPYLGPVLAAVLPTLSALITEPYWQTSLWVLLIFMLIQAVDNYYITPYFLGAEVNLSALATFVAIIAGGMLWGVVGMIIFVPVVSIAKIYFDRIPSLQHIGALIGNQGEKPSKKIIEWVKNIFANRKNNSK